MRAILFWVTVTMFVCGVASAQTLTTSNITSPVIVSTHAQMTSGTLVGTQLDAPISTYTWGGSRYWFATAWALSGGLKQSMLAGSLDNPYATVAWTKDTCHRASSNFCINGPYTAFTTIVPSDVVQLWFVNLYQPQPNSGNLLAFIHEEQVGNSGGVSGNQEGFTRIGLAWSSDGGNNWTYLGRIISPFGDVQPLNIQGAPYIVKDGYFYVYFTDSPTGDSSSLGIGVARASVSDVIAAAQAGNVGTNLWQKYYNGSFSQPGLGGQPSPIAPWGITHTQAVHSSYTGKYYLPLTFMSWGGVDTSVKLYESTDAVTWTPSLVIADESAASQRPNGGYQYCSAVDRDGSVNGEVGQYFYVYCEKDPLADQSNFALYRWEVNLGPSVDAYRQSSDYSSSQGPVWSYQFGGTGPIFDMTWLSPYWVGTDSWARIYPDSMHPGTSQVPVLKWVAPKAGTVFIGGTVRDADPTCGDGVSASLVHNGTQIFSATIANGDTVGQSPNMYLTVAAGDGLFFMVGPNSNNYCDMTRWDPSINYQ
ncbi:hypothetical protein ISN76_14060 [Dyella halodurans]|uniref:Exo-alpha-sialidase n=1 Tax=Dyella halodurans TaxID=1920171 RepID=A0ABV9C5K8_9GAMM|nr:hypothetical protein [Dyella halodurans]